ncbi:ATP-binding protein [Streptomyces zaomyceticus]|uniref:ATP-binding protein n=1 Tax=Streptomyces zaomyceticus TaxID=68286 RepID=UPI001674721C|nr:ATP-binding protein [Streptomyces zaomyceticus]GHG11106.1 ATP-binding protein [Streptomyces zaomyceticus]
MKSETSTPTGEFTLRLSSTRRGARLARLLAVQQLHDWGVTGSPAEAVELVVAELAANAVRHGRVPGRDFEVRMERGEDHVRIELSDARGERRPVPVGRPDEGGYGLLLVAALATAWGVKDRCVGKTVWATVPLTPR